MFGGTIASAELPDRVVRKQPFGADDVMVDGVDVLLLFVGAGIPFAVGFPTARFAFGTPEPPSLATPPDRGAPRGDLSRSVRLRGVRGHGADRDAGRPRGPVAPERSPPRAGTGRRVRSWLRGTRITTRQTGGRRTVVKATFPLGRVAGIRIGVHWSVLVIVIVLALGLAGRFPDAHPDRPPWQYWLTGLLGAVVFLLSLLAHELSHALVARRNGVDVDGITLWLLGGIARLRSEAPTPAAEVRIAGVGPLVSLLLGVLFGVLAGLFGALYGAGLVVETLAWLAGINLLVAVFNALPAAPLDGGRLLRALVWRRTGSPLRATAVATGAGRALGWVLIGVGLYLVLTGAALSGFWLAVIGWFLIATATAEGGQAHLRELLSGVPVRRAMGPDPVTVPASLTVARFLAAPEYRYRHSAFPVVDAEQRPVGLVNVKTAAGVPETEQDSPVTSVMIPIEDIPTPHPDDPLARVLPALDSSPAHRALAVENGRVVGTVTSSDISRVISWLASSSSWRARAF